MTRHTRENERQICLMTFFFCSPIFEFPVVPKHTPSASITSVVASPYARDYCIFTPKPCSSAWWEILWSLQTGPSRWLRLRRRLFFSKRGSFDGAGAAHTPRLLYILSSPRDLLTNIYYNNALSAVIYLLRPGVSARKLKRRRMSCSILPAVYRAFSLEKY